MSIGNALFVILSWSVFSLIACMVFEVLPDRFVQWVDRVLFGVREEA